MMFEETKRFCDTFLEKGMPGFDLMVMKDGKEVLRYKNGFSDAERGIPVRGNEKYNIYSCSKVMTCVAAMQLWEKGLFSLDDRLSDYMPEFEKMNVATENGVRPAKRPILIHNLFEMTAGFTYDRSTDNIRRAKDETGGRCPTREFMKYYARDPLAYEPGDEWLYSLGHDVLAALVEVISGQKFEEYVKESIFDPLGMNDSTFLLPESERKNVAPLYRYNKETGRSEPLGTPVPEYVFGSEYASGGAGVVSTVEDCMKFAEGVRLRKIIKDGTVELMKTDRLTEKERPYYWNKTDYGYGLGVRCAKKDGFFRDYGWGGAAGAYLAIDDERGLSLYFASHMLSSPLRRFRPYIYRFVCAELFGTEDPAELFKKSEIRSPDDYRF